MGDIVAMRYDAGVHLDDDLPEDGRERKAHVRGRVAFNSSTQMLKAAPAGFGLACLPADTVPEHVVEGHLKRVLDDWSTSFPGSHLFYPNCRQSSPAFAVLVKALRHER